MQMRYSYLCISLLVSPFLYSMEATPDKARPVTFAEQPSVEQEVDKSKPWYEQPKDWLESTEVDGTSLLDMKEVYETAPQMVKDLVEHLKDPNFYHAPEYRVLILHGVPGTGKTVLARAIGMYADWDVKFCTPSDFQRGDRNDAASKLHDQVDEILLTGAPTILVIDEINQLLENAESKYHDNDATSKEFWTTIDRVYGRHNFFLIGTTNRIYRIPPQIKTRIKARSCEITVPPTLEGKMRMLLNKMNRRYTQLTEDAHDDAKKLIRSHGKWTGRDYVELAFMCKLVARERDRKAEPMVFTKQILAEAAQRTDRFETTSMYYHQELSEEDRQDLYQSQNMWIQLMVQRLQKHVLLGTRTPGLTSEDGNFIIDNLFTSNQQRLDGENFNVEELRKKRHLLS